MRDLAKLLRTFESPGDNPQAFRSIDKLRPHLSLLMGRGGFRALLARALVLASAEVSWLAAVRVVPDGELDGLAVAQTSFDLADFSEGEIALLAQLFDLLEGFIGLALTLRLINQVWPQRSFNDADFSNTSNNEEAK